MPLAKSLSKVQKSAKNKNIHPKGRKFKQLNRATLREKKILDKKAKHSEKKENELLIVNYIKEIIGQDDLKKVVSFGLNDMKVFIEAFISRDDEELIDLQNQRRPNRPASNRQLILENRKKSEIQQFTEGAGFSIPDLSDVENVENLRNWNGTFGGINNVKRIYINKHIETL
ncbi:hypothetical protein PACTADRAFT_5421 [Pachysolen tannophilus NRRL Y-2460]|uniref:Translation machinery-associated protein 16 n=1 Tax=Pachysolen tannophilus NRRL Y-2460 TaxID=669874 RepID=A0A1E4TMS7_PACTA|nr:hypothetical protein PACTADRAFT_5421 [Pachysolen tannophilus NRRL Y-2460]